MTEFCVRGATEGDLTAIKAIEDVSFPDPWSEQTLRSMLTGSALPLAVICDGKLIGYAFIGVFGDEAEIYNIAVTPELRGKGASRILLEHVLYALESRAVRQLYLEVREHNGRAISFYKNFRFKEIGIRKNYYTDPTENAILMLLDFNENERQ